MDAEARTLDLELLSRVSDLELRAGMLVDGCLAGLHRSPKRGSSPEFREYREFRAGDSPRDIDWRATARRDEPQLRLRDDETRLSCRIVLDISRSLAFRGRRVAMSKFDFARTLAAALILILQHQNDMAGLTLLGKGPVAEFLPSALSAERMRMIAALEREADAPECTLLPMLERIAVEAPKRSLAVVISDFYIDAEKLRHGLLGLASRRIKPLLLQVLDPGELELEWDEPVLVADLESGRELLIHPDERKESYRRMFAEHLAGLRAAALNSGAELVLCKSSEPPLRALAAALASCREVRR